MLKYIPVSLILLLLVGCVTVDIPGMDHALEKPGLAADDYSINLIVHPEPKVDEPAKMIICIEEDSVPVTALEKEHEAIMHLMLIRRDTEHFAHIHPEFNLDCLEVEHTFEAAGTYNLFAEFKHDGKRYYQHFSLAVEDPAVPKAEPHFEEEAIFGDYAVKFTTEPAEITAGKPATYTFHVKEATGEAVELQPYLGEQMHSAVFGDAYFSHNHPGHTKAHDAHKDTSFTDTFPEPGYYAIIGEFKHNDVVTAAKFWVAVK